MSFLYQLPNTHSPSFENDVIWCVCPAMCHLDTYWLASLPVPKPWPSLISYMQESLTYTYCAKSSVLDLCPDTQPVCQCSLVNTKVLIYPHHHYNPKYRSCDIDLFAPLIWSSVINGKINHENIAILDI